VATSKAVPPASRRSVFAAPAASGSPRCSPTRSAALARPRLLWPRARGVQWNPADGLCLALELRIERGESRELSGRLVEIKPPGVRAVTFYSGRMASFLQLHRSRTSTGLTTGNIGEVD
jgi:hypothetical protein